MSEIPKQNAESLAAQYEKQAGTKIDLRVKDEVTVYYDSTKDKGFTYLAKRAYEQGKSFSSKDAINASLQLWAKFVRTMNELDRAYIEKSSGTNLGKLEITNESATLFYKDQAGNDKRVEVKFDVLTLKRSADQSKEIAAVIARSEREELKGELVRDEQGIKIYDNGLSYPDMVTAYFEALKTQSLDARLEANGFKAREDISYPHLGLEVYKVKAKNGREYVVISNPVKSHFNTREKTLRESPNYKITIAPKEGDTRGTSPLVGDVILDWTDDFNSVKEILVA